MKSFVLAQVFLNDYQDDQLIKLTRPVAEEKLAQAIQRAIEDWLSDNTIPF